MFKYHPALLLTFLLAIACFAQGPNKLPNPSADEIIAKHLVSLGTPDAISAIKSRVFVGDSRLTSKVGYVGQLEGAAQFASAGENILLAVAFNSSAYPYEKAAFNGKDVSVGRPNGNLTPFGEFIKSNKSILKEGLFGGVLSTAWPFLDKNSKLKFEKAGTAEIGGKRLYKLKVSGGGITGVAVVLFFDSETFRHIATEYSLVIPVGITKKLNPKPETDDFGTNTTTGKANMKQTYITVTERFANFAKSGDVVIPLTYVIDYSYLDSDTSRSLNLDIKFKDVYLNQDVGIEAFKVS